MTPADCIAALSPWRREELESMLRHVLTVSPAASPVLADWLQDEAGFADTDADRFATLAAATAPLAEWTGDVERHIQAILGGRYDYLSQPCVWVGRRGFEWFGCPAYAGAAFLPASVVSDRECNLPLTDVPMQPGRWHMTTDGITPVRVVVPASMIRTGAVSDMGYPVVQWDAARRFDPTRGVMVFSATPIMVRVSRTADPTGRAGFLQMIIVDHAGDWHEHTWDDFLKDVHAPPR